MNVCKRGHVLDYYNERLYAYYVRNLGRMVPKRECLTCRRDLARVAAHRAAPDRAWIGPPLSTPGLLPRDEELAMLVASQERDMRAGSFQAPQRFGGKPVLSLNLSASIHPQRVREELGDLLADLPAHWRWVA